MGYLEISSYDILILFEGHRILKLKSVNKLNAFASWGFFAQFVFSYPSFGENGFRALNNFKPDDHWSCIAQLSAEDMLKSAFIEEKKFKIIDSELFETMNDLDLL